VAEAVGAIDRARKEGRAGAPIREKPLASAAGIGIL
jgi:hypothetical protein